MELENVGSGLVIGTIDVGADEADARITTDVEGVETPLTEQLISVRNIYRAGGLAVSIIGDKDVAGFIPQDWADRLQTSFGTLFPSLIRDVVVKSGVLGKGTATGKKLSSTQRKLLIQQLKRGRGLQRTQDFAGLADASLQA